MTEYLSRWRMELESRRRQPRFRGLSSLPPLVVGAETLVAAGHVTICPSKTAEWVGTQVHLVERKTLLPHPSSRFFYLPPRFWVVTWPAATRLSVPTTKGGREERPWERDGEDAGFVQRWGLSLLPMGSGRISLLEFIGSLHCYESSEVRLTFPVKARHVIWLTFINWKRTCAWSLPSFITILFILFINYGLTQCCTQLKSFANEPFCSKYFHII